MNHYYRIGIIFIILFNLHQVPVSFASAVSAPNPVPELTEQELQQLEQQMESEINSFVQSLPPEAQEQFYKDVEELTETMSKMSEEELTQFIENVLTEPTAPVQPTPPVTPEKKPVEKVEKPKEEPKKPTTPKKQIKEAVKLLDDICDYIDSFLHKVDVIIDGERKIEKWGNAGLIKGWTKDLKWQKVMENNIRLAQKLRSLMSQDPKTKKYRFIDDFIQDKALYNNLAQLKKQLAASEPKIELPELGFVKLDLSSKNAIRKVVGVLLEAIKPLNIPESIDKIIAKYGPIAEKIKKEEEEAVKKALDAFKERRREPGLVKILGSEEPGYIPPTYPTEHDYGYGAPGYYPTYAPKEPSADKRAKEKLPEKKEGKRAPTAAPPAPAKPSTPAEKRIGEHLEKIENQLEDATESIDDILRYKDLASHLKQKGKPELTEAFTTTRKAILEIKRAIGRFNVRFKELPEGAKKKYETQINELLKKPKEKIDQLKKQLEPIKQEDIAPEKAEYQVLQLRSRINDLDEAINQIGKK